MLRAKQAVVSEMSCNMVIGAVNVNKEYSSKYFGHSR